MVAVVNGKTERPTGIKTALSILTDEFVSSTVGEAIYSICNVLCLI